MGVPSAAGFVSAAEEEGCAGGQKRTSFLGSLCPNSPGPASPSSPLLALVLLSQSVQGDPRLPLPERYGRGRGRAVRTLSPPWGPWHLLPTAPAAPDPQPEADGSALGLEAEGPSSPW